MINKEEKTTSGKNLFDNFALDTEKKEQGTTQTSDKPIDSADSTEEAETIEEPQKQETAVEKEKLFNFKKEESSEEPRKQEPKPKSAADIRRHSETTAEIYIASLDSVLAISLKKVIEYKYKKRIGGEEALTEAMDNMEQAEQNGGHHPEKLTSEQRTNLRLAKALCKRIDELPFTDDEVEKIKHPLCRLIEENPSYDLPPSALLMMAFSHAILPRLVDAIFD